jgi:hypothetical protein
VLPRQCRLVADRLAARYACRHSVQHCCCRVTCRSCVARLPSCCQHVRHSATPCRIQTLHCTTCHSSE